MIATVGGGRSFGSQDGETEEISLVELTEEQERRNRRMKDGAICPKRRFSAEDKSRPLA